MEWRTSIHKDRVATKHHKKRNNSRTIAPKEYLCNKLPQINMYGQPRGPPANLAANLGMAAALAAKSGNADAAAKLQQLQGMNFGGGGGAPRGPPAGFGGMGMMGAMGGGTKDPEALFANGEYK
jgi:hypothetical protein